jgi:cytidylate kinase
MMARRAKYTTALPVYVEPSVKERIEALADRENISMAQVIREIIDGGLGARERRS